MRFGEAGTDNRRIKVRTRLLEEDTAEFRVSDNGPGIRPDVLKRIFEPVIPTKSCFMQLTPLRILALAALIVRYRSGSGAREPSRPGRNGILAIGNRTALCALDRAVCSYHAGS